MQQDTVTKEVIRTLYGSYKHIKNKKEGTAKTAKEKTEKIQKNNGDNVQEH